MLHYFYKKCAAIRRNNLVDKAAVISNTLVDGNNKNYENVFDWAIKFRNNNEINHVLTVNIGIEDTKALIWLMTFLNILKFLENWQFHPYRDNKLMELN